jgi:tRNA A-37 threonylcarbamoyl transferase component Bud32/tetratricopeptide (TPR) repeat protein
MPSADSTPRSEAPAVQVLISRIRRGEDIDWESAERDCPSFMSRFGGRIRSFHRLMATRLANPPEPHSDSMLADPSFTDALSSELANLKLVMELDRGGQGVVYEAHHLTTNRRVALKILHDGPLASKAQRARFLREVTLVARLRHPNIVSVYETGSVLGHPYFIMELVEGLPIDDHALLMGLQARDIVQLFKKVCEAVSHAHQHGVIHRDLKPSNILVDSEGEPRVLDFGLAKDLEGEKRDRTLTGQMLGTLAYAAPEQALGLSTEADVRTDVYALGVILFKTITGGFPYPVNGTTKEVIDAVALREPRRLRQAAMAELAPEFRRLDGLNEDLERIVRKALEKDKARRYQSAAALAEDLGRYRQGEAVEARAESRWYLLAKTARRFRLPLSVAAVIAIAVIGSLIGVTAAWRRTSQIASLAQTGLQVASYLRVGQVYRDAGRTADAANLLEQAIDIAAQAPAGHPLLREQLFTSHHALSELYLAGGDLEKAQRHKDAARRLAADMLQADPTNVQVRRLLAFAWQLSGREAAAREDWATCASELANAERLFRDLLAESVEPDRLKYDLGFLLTKKGQCQRKLGNSESWGTYEESRSILRELCDVDPNRPAYLIELSRAESEMAAGHLSRNAAEDIQAAIQLLRGAESRLAALRSSESGGRLAWEIDRLLSAVRQNLALAEKRALATTASTGR